MATKGIEFSKLSLRDALDLAIVIEEEARDRYTEFAEQMTLHRTPDAASFFTFMSRAEERHRAELAIRRSREFGNQPSTITRAMIFDVEAPDYDEARAFMSVREALNSALRSETKAHKFFVEALRKVSNSDVKRLFEELRDEEIEHQDLVKAQLAKLPAGADHKADDYSDDPVAQ